MKTKLFLIAGFIAVTSLTAKAQKMVQEVGDLTMLVGQTKMLVEYDFDDLDMGKEGSESEYLEKKRTDLNKKEAGKGDKFVEGWKKNQTERYEPKFEELFNKTMKGKMDISQSNKDAKYKLIVKTLTLYPGYNVGVSKMPAYVSFAFIIVETANPDKILSKTVVKNVVGSQVMGYDFDAGSRLQESYAKAGKMRCLH
ncbi:MAG: hypothetical protein IPH89_03310 [Bacteroidetes bacterium]|nr:hypothetical protein [Bacteroidota bacterium]